MQYHDGILASELNERLRRGDASAWMHRAPDVLDAGSLSDAWSSALARRGTAGCPDTFQVYAHFPYCRASCRFCMYYHHVPGDGAAYDDYAQHIEGLCDAFLRQHGRIRVASAYFGGGTPSALPAAALDRTARAFRAAFDVDGSFTCEAHPNTLDEAKIEALARAGVNRASMGIQTLDVRVLQVIGRHNRPLEEIAELIRFAQERGVSVNVDLVAGLPEQSQASLRDDIARVLDLGADEVTLYRYQPVTRLPEAARPEMAYRSVFTLPLVARAVRRGYLPYLPDQTAHSARLYRAGPAWARLRDLGLWKLRRFAGRTSEQPPGYWEFSHTRSHIIGLGVGSVSHLYGHAWYREVTALDSVPTTPAYFGSRLTVEDECRQELLAALRQRAWSSASELERVTGIDARNAFAEAFDAASRLDAFEWRGDRFRLGGATRDDARERVIDAIAPVVSRPPRSSLPLASLQPELISFPDDSSSRTPGIVREWCDALSVPAVGKKFGSARVVAVDDRSVSFRVVDKETTPLRVFVERPGQRPSFVTSTRFAISYGGRRDSELTDAERDFLADLARRTKSIDAS